MWYFSGFVDNVYAMQNRKKLTAAFRRLFHKGADPQQKELFARWIIHLDLSEGKIFRDETQEREIGTMIGQKLHEHFFPLPERTSTFRFPSWMPTSAAAILIVAALALWFMPAGKVSNKTVFTESSTTTCQRKIITLSDGSKITLSNSSRIRYPKIFNGSLREVFLEGEGFFDIIHNPAKPFLVRSGKLNIQVLGTSFNIRHYEKDKTIDVVVATGKVGVFAKGGKKTWMLSPGKLLAYNPLTGKALESIVNPSDYTDWQNGALIFNNQPLEDICNQLERWYGIRITIKDPALKSKPIRLKQKNESLPTVMKMLGIVGGFKYEIKDKTVKVWQ